MSIPVIIVGESGSGKSRSLKNLDPTKSLLIQAIAKPLPFRGASRWTPLTSQNPRGSVYQTDNHANIIGAMERVQRNIIVVDDIQACMSFPFMRRSDEKGYQKFIDIGRGCWDIIQHATALPGNKRIYMLWHSEESEAGFTKVKTIGKMLDEKIILESMVSIVLGCQKRDGKHFFRTVSTGMDRIKAPEEMFEDELIENDLLIVDNLICKYYEIGE